MNPSEFTIVSWISALTGEQSMDDISTFHGLIRNAQVATSHH